MRSGKTSDLRSLAAFRLGQIYRDQISRFAIATVYHGRMISHAMTVAPVDMDAFGLAASTGEQPYVIAGATRSNIRRACIHGLPVWSSHSHESALPHVTGFLASLFRYSFLTLHTAFGFLPLSRLSTTD